jgi:hypothetical protein
MIDRLNQAFASQPVQFNQTKLAELTHYELSDDFQLHYHGDGAVRERRKIQVLDNSESSIDKPKIHESVFRLIGSNNVYLNTPLDSFSKVDKIQYCPKSVNGLMGKYIAVS